MAALYLDNDVSLRLASLLRAAGHRVATARGQGRAGATDDAQLLIAAQRHWVLITSNRHDFRLLHDAWRTWPAAFGLRLPPHPGVLVLDHARPAVQFEALGALLSRASPTELEGELFWWRTVGGWRRLIGTAWEAYPADPGAQRTT